MGLFDNLGLGLAQIGSGISRGELAGTAQQERLMQQKQMQDYRNALLEQNRQKAVTTDASKASALDLRARMPYIHALADADLNDYFARNPTVHAHYLSIAYGHLDPAHGVGYDPNTGTLSVGGKSYTSDTTPGGAETPPPGPPPATVPPPDQAAIAGALRGTPPQAGPSGFDLAAPPTQQPTLGEIGLAGPRNYPTPFGMAPSTQLLPSPAIPPVLSGEPKGGLPPYRPVAGPQQPPATTTDTTGTPATTNTGPAPGGAPSRDPTLAEDYARGPLPGETDKAFNARMGTRAKLAGLDIRSVIAAAQLPGIEARGQLGTMRAIEEPERFAGSQENTAAGIGLRKAQTAALPIATNTRIAQVTGQLQHWERQEDQARANAADAHRHAVEMEGQGKAGLRLRQAEARSMDALRQAQTSRLKFTLSQAKELNLNADDKEAFTGALRLLTATTRGKFGDTTPMFTGPARQALQDRVDSTYQRLGMKPIFGGGAAGSPDRLSALRTNPGTPMTPGAPATVTGPAAAPLTTGELGLAKRMLGSPGVFDAALAKVKESDPTTYGRLLRAYQTLKGRAYTGGR